MKTSDEILADLTESVTQGKKLLILQKWEREIRAGAFDECERIVKSGETNWRSQKDELPAEAARLLAYDIREAKDKPTP